MIPIFITNRKKPQGYKLYVHTRYSAHFLHLRIVALHAGDPNNLRCTNAHATAGADIFSGAGLLLSGFDSKSIVIIKAGSNRPFESSFTIELQTIFPNPEG